ncbi:MAG: ABC transporter permease [Pirellulales bacterium]
MIGFLARRLAQALLTLFMSVCLVFFAVRMLPGNPVLAKFGQHVDPQQIERIRREQGWDRPVHVQLVDFVRQVLVEGDLGESLARSNENVSEALRNRIPATVELTLAALMIAVPVGLAAGVAAAVWRNGWIDYLCMTGSLLGVSIPVFFLGICLRALFPSMPPGYRLPLSAIDFEPLTGLYTLDTLLRGRPDLWVQALKHLCLPALALSSIPMALIARVTRASMLEVLSTDYLRTARAKGAGLWRRVWRHAFPNAAVPVTNIVGLQTGVLLSGAVLTETVFDWPGLGKYIVDALLQNDYVVVQGGGIVVAVMFVSLNLLLDLCYLWLDPRLRHAS